ncbi:MAG: hypothetical protein ACTSWN_10085 [Promethearchaeota archaeon]
MNPRNSWNIVHRNNDRPVMKAEIRGMLNFTDLGIVLTTNTKN